MCNVSWIAQERRKLHNQEHQSGFSLLEIVVAVSIMLVLAVVGFISYRALTDNAREAAVERAADDVFTAVMAVNTLPSAQTVSATDDEVPSAQLASFKTASAPHLKPVRDPALVEIQNDYNASSGEDIQVEVKTDGEELAVIASGWDDKYVAVRSTLSTLDGTDTIPEAPGTFIFTTASPNTTLFMRNKSDDATLTFNGEEIPLGGGTIELPYEGEYIYNGTFEELVSSSRSDILEISTWGETGTTKIDYAFKDNKNLIYVDAPPKTVTRMTGVFQGAEKFNQDISNWDVSNVTHMGSMFLGAKSFNNGGQPLNWKNTNSLVSTFRMFEGANNFNQDVSNVDVSNVTNMNSMFSGARSFNNGGQPLDWKNTSSLVQASSMFDGANNFNQDISNWDVSNVTHMGSMFLGAKSFNNDGQPLDWRDTSSLVDTSDMFRQAWKFDQDISNWDVSKVTHMSRMFYYAKSFNNGGQPLDWRDTSSLVYVSSMFENANNFNQDVSNWDVSKVMSMGYMFAHAKNFNNGGQPLDWRDTSSLTNTRYMFNHAWKFDQDISNWDVSNVTNMNRMFARADSFNNGGQPLLDWMIEGGAIV